MLPNINRTIIQQTISNLKQKDRKKEVSKDRPEVRIGIMNQDGEIDIHFTQKMLLPEKIDQKVYHQIFEICSIRIQDDA